MRKGNWICENVRTINIGNFRLSVECLVPWGSTEPQEVMVLRKSPPPCSTAPSSCCAPLPSLAQERPGDMHGMPEQTPASFCHHQNTAIFRAAQRCLLGVATDTPCQLSSTKREPRVQGDLAVMARTNIPCLYSHFFCHSMLKIILQVGKTCSFISFASN